VGLWVCCRSCANSDNCHEPREGELGKGGGGDEGEGGKEIRGRREMGRVADGSDTYTREATYRDTATCTDICRGDKREERHGES
jgi:hypothetical protein